ncbi:hypothetical protein [Flavobacterium davisii]|uniref:Uncharacterized protein n=1 Tax=Flavobacterium columnare TaxID=996 RepID=A0A8G0KSQ3_9FLAO|nr:hypothetical protein [Flavobacterium davisii]QYS89497.1 hypothetical protein JJC05_04245 [Flavobacterium davisii]
MKKLFFRILICLLSFSSINAQCWFTQFQKDFETGSIEFKKIIAESEDGMATYQRLYDGGSKYVLKNGTYLRKFEKLTPQVQNKIAKLTDDKNTGSTLTKFLDDCEDAEFVKFVNNPENSKFVDAFSNHKLTDNEAQNIGDLVAELKLNNESNPKVEKWLERSDKISIMKGRFKIADDFEKANNTVIKNNRNPPCNSWGGNGNRTHYTQLQVGEPKVILDDALVDPVAVTTDARGRKTYKAIYHDSKLTNNAPWTTNQKSEIIDKFTTGKGVLTDANGAQYLEFEVKNTNETLSKLDGNFLKSGDKIRVYKTDIYKSISNGDGKSIIKTIQIFK